MCGFKNLKIDKEMILRLEELELERELELVGKLGQAVLQQIYPNPIEYSLCQQILSPSKL